MTRVRPYGERAVLVEVDGLDAVDALRRALDATPPPGAVEWVPAATTVLVRFDPGRTSVAALTAALAELPAAAAAEDAATTVEIPVVYDGEDLDAVAALAGCGADEVVARHAAPTYTVAFCGFTPGFGYLVGGDPSLAVPRLATPRTRVPAGSVAVADAFTGVYPIASPGGWRLLGRTPLPLWDPDRRPPALLAPGTRVRFRPVAAVAGPEVEVEAVPEVELGRTGAGAAGATDGTGGDPMATVEVVATGPLATVQDPGRPGWAAVGVSRSGAADRGAAALAGRLVGNDPDAAVIECTFGGLALRFERAALVAVTGAPCPVWVGSTAASTDAPVPVPAGAVVRLGPPTRGLRTYVAVRGGFDVPAVLGSRASDLLTGVGPPPLRVGDRLAVGHAAAGDPPPVDLAVVRRAWDTPVGLLPGPRLDWFAPDALDALAAGRYVVTSASNRTALRLDGPPLVRAVTRELPSEGLVPGAVQVPPDGRPVVFLVDHPVTGGYPVVGVVPEADLDALAQRRPGDEVRFARR